MSEQSQTFSKKFKMLTADEINERAWMQMQVLSDEEVLNHPLLVDEEGLEDVWDSRIRLRDKFFNELWQDLREPN